MNTYIFPVLLYLSFVFVGILVMFIVGKYIERKAKKLTDKYTFPSGLTVADKLAMILRRKVLVNDAEYRAADRYYSSMVLCRIPFTRFFRLSA